MLFASSICFEFFAAGRNNYGQLGLNTIVTEVKEFTAMKELLEGDLQEVRAGKQHAFAVNTDGVGYGWGDNTYGQISQNATLAYTTKPIELSFFTEKKVKLRHVDGGNYHSVALDTEGNVWTWGRNTQGQLGRETSESKDLVPTMINASKYGEKAVKQVHAQMDNTYVFTEDGHLYAFGTCRNGVCPSRDAQTNELKVGFVIDKFYVGEQTLFVQNAADKKIYASGINQNSQLCFSKAENDGGNYQLTLRQIPIQDVEYIAQGHFHTLIRLNNQNVVGCGNNLDHQMSPNAGEFASPTFLFAHENLTSVAACEDGSIFVVQNKVYVIGTQLYGELGMKTSDISTQMREIQVPGAVLLNKALCRSEFSFLYNTRIVAPEEKGLTTGQIVAIVFGSIFGIIVLIFLSWIIFRLVKDRHKYQKFVSGAVAEVADA